MLTRMILLMLRVTEELTMRILKQIDLLAFLKDITGVPTLLRPFNVSSGGLHRCEAPVFSITGNQDTHTSSHG